MKVSVAIATYNRAEMVEQAVASALDQSRQPEEIVVSDDASTDGTPSVLSRLAAADSRLRVFRQERNTGGTANANFAIGQTRGDFIAWCSDDDCFLPGHLEESVAYLTRHPEIGIVHSSFIDAVEQPSGRALVARRLRSRRPLMIRPGALMRYLVRYYDWPFHPSTLVMRRWVWELVGGFDERYALADTDWFVRAAEKYGAAMLPRHGVLNRRHAGNWSNRLGSAKMQIEIFEIVERSILRRWPLQPVRRAFWRAAWRAMVRLRLALTVWMRLRSGHENAARAAWGALATHTGRRLPEWLERAGSSLIRRWCARNPQANLSVTPL